MCQLITTPMKCIEVNHLSFATTHPSSYSHRFKFLEFSFPTVSFFLRSLMCLLVVVFFYSFSSSCYCCCCRVRLPAYYSLTSRHRIFLQELILSCHLIKSIFQVLYTEITRFRGAVVGSYRFCFSFKTTCYVGIYFTPPTQCHHQKVVTRKNCFVELLLLN